MPQPLKTLPASRREEARRLLAEGQTPTKIAAALGLSWRDWKRLVASDRALAEVIDEAMAREEEELVRALRDPAAKNVVGSIFLLKARHRYVDTPKHEATAPVVNVAVLLPKAAKDLREYERIIAAPAPSLPAPMKAVAAPVETETVAAVSDDDDWDT